MTGSEPSLLTLALSLLATGAVAGILAGLLGVGGGIIIVPILFTVFGFLGIDPSVGMHLAVGTSLATIIPTAVASVLSHHRKGAVDWILFRSWLPWLVLGVVTGTWLANTLFSGAVLRWVFGGVALVVAFDLLVRADRQTPGQSNATSTNPYLYTVRLAPVPTLIGGFSALMGIGGGTLSVPFLNAMTYPMHRAVATSAGFGLIIAIPAAAGYLIGGWDNPVLPEGSLGYVNIYGFVLITVTSTFTAPVGSWLAHALSAKSLRLLFAAFLLATSARMFF